MIKILPLEQFSFEERLALLFLQCLEANRHSDEHIFFELSGHVDWISVSAHSKGVPIASPKRFDSYIKTEGEQRARAEEDLAKMEAYVQSKITHIESLEKYQSLLHLFTSRRA